MANDYKDRKSIFFIQTLFDHRHELGSGDLPVAVRVHFPELPPDQPEVRVPEIEFGPTLPLVLEKLGEVDAAVAVGVGVVEDVEHGVDQLLSTRRLGDVISVNDLLDHPANGFNSRRASEIRFKPV